MITRRRITSLGVAALAAALAPFTLNTSGEGGLVRLSSACGQASECSYQQLKICSTHHNDYKDYACSKGCETQVEEAPSLETIES